jgi:hypothetical protein
MTLPVRVQAGDGSETFTGRATGLVSFSQLINGVPVLVHALIRQLSVLEVSARRMWSESTAPESQQLK